MQAEPAAARAEHRVRLLQRPDPLAHALVGRLLERRQELVQRRVEQADRHRQPGHRLEDPLEVALLDRQQLVERRPPAVLVLGQDHLAHDREALLGHEHVLGAAEADALRRRTRAPWRRPRACRRSRAPSAGASRRPSRGSCSKSSLICGGTSGDVADDDRAGAAVDRDRVALARARGRRSSSVRALDVDRRAPRSRRRTACPSRARRPPRARSCRRARSGCPAACDQAVDVVRGRLPADEDDALARLAALARPCRRRARSRRQAAPGDAFSPRAATSDVGASGRSSGAAAGRAAPGRSRATASSREIRPSSTMSTAALQRGRGRPLADARLQQVERARPRP